MADEVCVPSHRGPVYSTLMPTTKATKTIDRRTRWRIAAHVRKVMEERDISQADLARTTGVDAGNLSKLLRGVDDRIGLEFVLALHRKLHIDANVLLDHDPPRKFFLDGQLSGPSGQTSS